jgi:hypothetical protein
MKQKIKVGDIVAFNNLPDAVWFDVLEIDGPRIVIREHGTDFAKQIMDRSLVKQIRKP